jgi:putative flippase GtrA
VIGYTIRHRVRFVQYTFFGVLAFGFDLLLLFTLNNFLGLLYYLAVPIAFVIATSTHYALLRTFVYHDSTRALGEGYALFLAIMISNVLAITLLVALLVEYTAITLYPARMIIGTLFGLLSFFLNSRYNFKIV